MPSYEPNVAQVTQMTRLHDDLMLYANAQCIREQHIEKTIRSNELLLYERARRWRKEKTTKKMIAGNLETNESLTEKIHPSPARKRRFRARHASANEHASDSSADTPNPEMVCVLHLI